MGKVFKYLIKVSGLDPYELDRLDYLINQLGGVGEAGRYYLSNEALLKEVIKLLEINRVRFGIIRLRLKEGRNLSQRRLSTR